MKEEGLIFNPELDSCEKALSSCSMRNNNCDFCSSKKACCKKWDSLLVGNHLIRISYPTIAKFLKTLKQLEKDGNKNNDLLVGV